MSTPRHPWPALGLVCALVALVGCTRQQAADPAVLRAAVGEQPVVLLSAAWCGYCRTLRSDLDRWGVTFSEYDVEDGAAGTRAYSMLGGRGVPVLLVNEQRFVGYVPNRIHDSLRAAGLLAALAPR